MDNLALAYAHTTDAPQSHPQTSNHLQSRNPETDLETIFSNVYSYPWAQDSDFQSGLSAIFGNTEQLASEDSIYHDIGLMLQAQCFYFARKYNLPTPIDVAAYKAWRKTRALSEPPTEIAEITPHEPPYNFHHTQSSSNSIAPPLPQNDAVSPPNPSAPPPKSASPSTVSFQSSQPQPEPPYPTSFATIVDLITRNQPIPGIEEIPNTVLDASLSQPNKTPRRSKPWEKETNTTNLGSPTLINQTNTPNTKEAEEAGALRQANGSNWMQAIERRNGFQAAHGAAAAAAEEGKENQEPVTENNNNTKERLGEKHIS